MNKARIVIRVRTTDEIQEVYDMVLDDMSRMFHPDCYTSRIRSDYAQVETTIHNITIELHEDNPYIMKGRRANLVVLKDFLPESQDAFCEIYGIMIGIGGFVIDYDTFVKHYGKNGRGIMKYDVMANYHDYKCSQWKIEEAIGIERKHSWTF